MHTEAQKISQNLTCIHISKKNKKLRKVLILILKRILCRMS